MEKEVVAQLAAMFGLRDHLGHLTTSGTIANLEALFVARRAAPGPGRRLQHGGALHARPDVPASSGVEGHPVRRRRHAAGWTSPRWTTCCATGRGRHRRRSPPAPPGSGAVDPVDEVARRCAAAHGVRVHVDAAYGGFFTLLAGDEPGRARRRAVAGDRRVRLGRGRPAQARAAALRLRRRAVPRPGGRAASTCTTRPYTYFTSDELHLGEISLECSRAGRGRRGPVADLPGCCRPPRTGLGQVLAAGRRAALRLGRR